jgi:hypothetical protein
VQVTDSLFVAQTVWKRKKLRSAVVPAVFGRIVAPWGRQGRHLFLPLKGYSRRRSTR